MIVNDDVVDDDIEEGKKMKKKKNRDECDWIGLIFFSTLQEYIRSIPI